MVLFSAKQQSPPMSSKWKFETPALLPGSLSPKSRFPFFFFFFFLPPPFILSKEGPSMGKVFRPWLPAIFFFRISLFTTSCLRVLCQTVLVSSVVVDCQAQAFFSLLLPPPLLSCVVCFSKELHGCRSPLVCSAQSSLTHTPLIQSSFIPAQHRIQIWKIFFVPRRKLSWRVFWYPAPFYVMQVFFSRITFFCRQFSLSKVVVCTL